jgi:glycosyltransferase involved in cell wall biosynthesis
LFTPAIDFSVVVVAYDMARELPRTLHSLSRAYQRGIEELRYEVIVVDNGSPRALSAEMVSEYGPEFRLLRIERAGASPGPAINRGAALARGKHLGLVIDGARVLSPGVLQLAREAFHLQAGVVAVAGFHLGPEHQRLSSQRGYDQAVEDKLLRGIAWPGDGYRLFEIASLAGSAPSAWHGPLAESNCVFLSRALFEQCRGCDEGFRSAGGGLVNLDFYQRICAAVDYRVYHLAGEGCFHQIHGGVTTGGPMRDTLKFNDMQAEYESVRGRKFRHLDYRPTLLGSTSPAALPLSIQGLGKMTAQCDHLEVQAQHLRDAGLDYSNPPSHAETGA